MVSKARVKSKLGLGCNELGGTIHLKNNPTRVTWGSQEGVQRKIARSESEINDATESSERE